MRLTLFVLCLFVCHASHAAEQVLGLVEVPSLFGTSNPDGPPGLARPAKITPFPLFAEPRAGAKTIATVSKPEDLLSLEHGYEESSAVAFAEKDGWYKVATPTAKGWLPSSKVGTFRSVETLLTKGFLFLTPEWDGKLIRDPAHPEKFEAVKVTSDQAGAKLLSSKTVAGKVWRQIEIYSPDTRCEGPEPKPSAKGWVPAFSKSGESVLWFYSRGC